MRMSPFAQTWLVLAGVFGVGAVLGCGGGNSNEYKPAAQLPVAPDEAHHGHEHAHGPHGGYLIELGQEEYHAELVVDGKTHTLTIYLLGSDGKSAAGTAADNVTIALGGETSLTLQAVEGAADTYQLTDAKAVDELLDDGFLHGTLSVKIGEKSYSVELDIHFEEEGHDHAEHAHPAGDMPRSEDRPAETAEPAQ